MENRFKLQTDCLKLFTLYSRARRPNGSQNFTNVQKETQQKAEYPYRVWSMDSINIILQICEFNPNTRKELHKLQLKSKVALRQARVLTKTKP